MLLALANEASEAPANGQTVASEKNTEKDLADMDLDDLVNAAFMDDDE